jgi:hypothetical protein
MVEVNFYQDSGGRNRLRGTCYLHLEGRISCSNIECNSFLRNVGMYHIKWRYISQGRYRVLLLDGLGSEASPHSKLILKLRILNKLGRNPW